MGGIFLKKRYVVRKSDIDRMRKPGRYSREECMEMEMTPKERNIFLAIDEHWRVMGYVPSYDDIMRATGDKGRGNVSRVVNNLCKLGVCKKLPGKDRSVRPVYINFRNIE